MFCDFSRFWRLFAVMAICFSSYLMSSDLCRAEEAVWQLEKNRVEQAIVEGDFQKAQRLAEALEDEFARARKSFKTKSKWSDYEWAAIDIDLLVGSVERLCGNYGGAQSRFNQALAELNQVKKRNSRVFVAANAAAQRNAALAGGLMNDGIMDIAKGFDNESAMLFARGMIKKQLASRLAAQGNSDAGRAQGAIDVVSETQLRMVEVYDAMGTLAIDRVFSVGESSGKSLREAEKYFRAAQELREGMAPFVVDRQTVHGNSENTFRLNYGNLHLKRAELALSDEGAPNAGDGDVGDLLDRADDYFNQAEEGFSGFRTRVEGWAKIVHLGPVADLKKKLVESIFDENPKESRSEIRAAVDAWFLENQLLCLGDADIHFKQSELTLARLKNEQPGNQGVEAAKERAEKFDETEQRLLDAVDRIKLISEDGNHPFLILPYSELVVLEAMRAREQARKPDAQFSDFLKTAEGLMERKEMPPASVQGAYLENAKKLWAQAGG
jgi:hypothetical protein